MNAPAALVTGASGGIGRAVCEKLLDAGYRVAAAYNENVPHITDGAEVFPLQADLSSRGGAAYIVGQTVKRFGRIDALINCAGISRIKQLQDISDEEWAEMLEVNLSAVFRTCRACLPHMLAAKSGSIVNISSVWGISGAACESHYSAAKAGVIGFSKALAQELAPSGITVNCVAPGVIDTKMNGQLSGGEMETLVSQIPAGRPGRAGEVADAVLFLLKNRYITGQTLNVSGGFVI